MNAFNPPFLVYTGRKDLGTEHVRAIVESLHWEWSNTHFQHIRDYDDWKAEQDWLADQAAYDEQQEREAAEQEAHDKRMDNLNALGIAPAPWN